MKKYTFFILVTLLSTSAVCQNQKSASVKLVEFARNAALFSRNYTQEKVYMHFDNTGYFLGETIWFKAYIVNALNNQPSDMSKTLYVQLLTSEGQILQTKKLQAPYGVCSSEFALPDSLPGGFYEVRAYTRAMMNFGNEVVFSRIFPVFDKPTIEGNFEERNMTKRKFSIPIKREDTPYKDAVNIFVFPEGGSLVQGLTSTVGFKVVDKEGRSVDVSGTVLDENNREVTTFKTTHQGMGKFTLNPSGKKYTLQLNDGIRLREVNIPTPDTSGVVLTCNYVNQDSLVIHLQKSKNIAPTDSMALIVTCRGKLIDLNMTGIPDKGLNLSFNTKKFPAGVYQFTLYDVNGRIMADRLIFKYPKNTTNLKAVTDKMEYGAFEKIQLMLTSTDTLNIKTGTSISLAVRDGELSDFSNSDNSSISTNLLLSSELKGFIENPNWYFSQNSQDRLDALDLLMLTQGWRRYDWKFMSGIVPFKADHPIEEGLLLDGEVRSVLFKKPKPNVQLLFYMRRGSYAIQGKTMTDSLGKFSFKLSPMFDVWNLTMQTTENDKTKDLRILLNRTFSPPSRWLATAEQELWKENNLLKPLEEDTIAQLLGIVRYSKVVPSTNPEGLKEVQLQEIVTTAKQKVSFQELAARNASLSYDVDKEVDDLRDVGNSEAPSIVAMLENSNKYFIVFESDSGVTYRYKTKKAVFRIFATSTKVAFGSTDTRSVEELTTQDVEKILIIEDAQTLQEMDPMYDGSYYVIALYLYPAERLKEPLGTRISKYEGYAVPKEFYSPTYRPGVAVLEADFRRTLYWNPDVILDKTGKAQLEFYNTKTTKKLVISAEGITSNGTLLKN
jgi:hypothetical protein